jgi:hypothetical protein
MLSASASVTPTTTPSGPRTPSALSLSLSPTTTTATSARHDRTRVCMTMTSTLPPRRQPCAVGDGVSVGLRHAHDDAISPSTYCDTVCPQPQPLAYDDHGNVSSHRPHPCLHDDDVNVAASVTACRCGRRCHRRQCPSRPRRRRQVHGRHLPSLAASASRPRRPQQRQLVTTAPVSA